MRRPILQPRLHQLADAIGDPVDRVGDDRRQSDPELEAPGDIVFTYVCNTFSPPELTSRPDIYLPQVIREPMLPTASR